MANARVFLKGQAVLRHYHKDFISSASLSNAQKVFLELLNYLRSDSTEEVEAIKILFV